MIRAAICDDEPTILDYLHNHISKGFKNQGAEIQIDKFISGKDFLNAHKAELFDVVFLDIDMPEISGFDVAEEISLGVLSAERACGSQEDDEQEVIIFGTNANCRFNALPAYREVGGAHSRKTSTQSTKTIFRWGN